MNLVIVESPNKCRKIRSFLGSGWNVEASVGHIRSIPANKINVDPKTYEPIYKTDSGKSKVVSHIKDLAKASCLPPTSCRSTTDETVSS